MKIYLVGGLFLHTQAEAAARAKSLGRTFDPDIDNVEVPTDRKSLIAFLNDIGSGQATHGPMLFSSFSALPLDKQLLLAGGAVMTAHKQMKNGELTPHMLAGAETMFDEVPVPVPLDADDLV